MQASPLLGHALMEGLHDAWSLLAGRLDVIVGCLAGPVRTGSGEILTHEHSLDGLKGGLGQKDLRHTVAPP